MYYLMVGILLVLVLGVLYCVPMPPSRWHVVSVCFECNVCKAQSARSVSLGQAFAELRFGRLHERGPWRPSWRCSSQQANLGILRPFWALSAR